MKGVVYLLCLLLIVAGLAFAFETTFTVGDSYINGTVGINTDEPKTDLDLDGIFRLRPLSTATCNGTVEGSIYYDAEDRFFYGCNSTAWIKLDTVLS